MLITKKLHFLWKSKLWGRFWFITILISYLTHNHSLHNLSRTYKCPWKTTKTCRECNKKIYDCQIRFYVSRKAFLLDINQHPHLQPYQIWWDCFVDDIFFLMQRICRPWSNKKRSKNDNLENIKFLKMSQNWRFQISTRLSQSLWRK